MLLQKLYHVFDEHRVFKRPGYRYRYDKPKCLSEELACFLQARITRPANEVSTVEDRNEQGEEGAIAEGA